MSKSSNSDNSTLREALSFFTSVKSLLVFLSHVFSSAFLFYSGSVQCLLAASRQRHSAFVFPESLRGHQHFLYRPHLCSLAASRQRHSALVSPESLRGHQHFLYRHTYAHLLQSRILNEALILLRSRALKRCAKGTRYPQREWRPNTVDR